MKRKDFEYWYAKVGHQLAEREVAQAVFDLLQGQVLGEVKRERNRYRKALKKIRRLNPANTEWGYNERGATYCFNQAQDIVSEALGNPTGMIPFPAVE